VRPAEEDPCGDEAGQDSRKEIVPTTRIQGSIERWQVATNRLENESVDKHSLTQFSVLAAVPRNGCQNDL
jgi:hypothetical protein